MLTPLLLLTSAPIVEVSPLTVLWAAPAILVASMLIAWGAESAQFFVAQGFALAILALLQTLPEFAVEAVLAWKQQQHYLLANLTGALRLLTGIGWPMIYATAAFVHRRRTGAALRRIQLDPHHSVEVIGLGVPLVYIFWIWFKGTLTVWDGVVLIAFYTAYIAILSRMPPQDSEEIESLERVPRTIVTMPRWRRMLTIFVLFLAGGALIYFMAEPFLGSLLALAVTAGMPSFLFIQWVAPLVSEFPEMASTFYWARTVDRAPMALMNMVSSNINQWTLLTAMLPIVFSLSAGSATALVLDPHQRLELLLTAGQGLIAMLFLINMQLSWWEASAVFGLFVFQFVFSEYREWVTAAYFVWCGVELVRMLAGWRKPLAIREFLKVWHLHVWRRAEGH